MAGVTELPILKKRFITRWFLLGLPFFALGVFFLFFAATVDSANADGLDTWNSVGFFIAASIFTLIGLSFVTAFSRIVIDKNLNTVKLQRGIIVPFKSTLIQLSDVRALELSRESRSGGYQDGLKNSSITVYPIRLVMKESNIIVHEPRNIVKARALAEELAKFTNMPVHDKSHDTLEVRKACELDLGIAQRESVARAPKVPAAMLKRVKISNNSNGCPVYDIQFPPVAQHYTWLTLVAGIALLVSFAMIVLHLLNEKMDNLPFDLIAALLDPLMIIPLVLSFIAYKILNVILPELNITVDNKTVLIVKTVLGFKFKTCINSQDIEGLLAKDHDNEWGTGSILVISDRKQITLGFCQNAKELDVCRNMMIYAMK